MRTINIPTLPALCLLAAAIFIGTARTECAGYGSDGQGSASPIPVPVYVVTLSPEGFAPPQPIADSTRDLIRALGKRKGLCLAPTPAEAYITIEVTERHTGPEITTIYGPTHHAIVSATLTAGAYTTTLTGEGQLWRVAAERIAKLIERWARDNRQMLQAGRVR